VIGAGSSGIACAKILAERGLPFVSYEKSDRVGGNWVFGNKNGVSSCYRGLFINTSKTRMAYSDFPMPDDYPDFPHHTHIARYFEAYVDRFGLRRHIRFETTVERIEKRADGRYDVHLSSGAANGEVETFDAIAVANGHHWDPRWPDPPYPGTFEGEQLHSHDYVDPDGWKDRDVLVVGMGNSAMDIAVEASYVARRTILSSRRGAWVIPKYFLGRPADTLPLGAKMPFALRRAAVEGLLALTVGPMTRYGLPQPDHRLGEAHPTISGRILDRLAHGAIVYRPKIERLDGRTVHFQDGSAEHVDVIVWCTGYKVTFPFFAADLVSAPGNDLPLYRRVFHPRHRGLFFVALLQPLGATMPLAEAQSRWIADYLLGEYALPPAKEMERDIEKERAAMFARYVASPRHTMQVDFDDYLAGLERERAKGRARARSGRGQRFEPAVAR
jgi:cation diffusion facilitator CzcD-associated flavoprotein CzcO